MTPSRLKPFLRDGLDILFVGLNPATGSDTNGHYFSVRSDFWDQLFQSGLIARKVDKSNADDAVFGSNLVNANRWNYGITDLVTEHVESDSAKVKPTRQQCAALAEIINKHGPRAVVILGRKVRDHLDRYYGAGWGQLWGQLPMPGPHAPFFFAVPFPHNNNVGTQRKVDIYHRIFVCLSQS